MTPEILYEDNHVMVVVKPPNMPTQGDLSGDLDLLSWCKEYIRTSRNKKGEAYVGLVHRLDRPAGGLVVFALSSKAAARLSAQLQSREMHRDYLCVVRGVPASGTHRHFLLGGEKAQRVVPPHVKGAKEAILTCRSLSTRYGLSLVQVSLQTGRKHQIRAQMATLKTPLYGDQRYDFGRAKPGEQLALWAFCLSFVHPIKDTLETFTKLPEGGIWDTFMAEIQGVLLEENSSE